MVGIAAAVVCGMLLSSSETVSVPLLVFLGLGLSLFVFIYRHTGISTLAAYILIGIVAGCSFLVVLPGLPGTDLGKHKIELPYKGASIIGNIAGFPEFYPKRTENTGFWVFEVSCEGIKITNSWKTVRGLIDIRVAGERAIPPPVYGSRVVCRGTLRKHIFPGENAIEMDVDNLENIQNLCGENEFSLIAWGRAWRDKVSARLEQDIDGLYEQEAVLKALVLGYRKQLPAPTMERFRRTGTLHIFAISGLHVGIIGMLLIIVLKTSGIPRDWFGIWLLPILTVYVISTGMKPSAFRALTMAGVYVLAPFLRCKPDVPSSVAFAGIILLLLNPMEILSPGFIYSFTVVAFIVMVYSALPKHIMQGHWLKTYGLGLIITSLAANLASIPLSAVLFGVFSPIALVGNLIVVPLTFCIVLSGWLSILIPFASGIFNHAAVVFINLLLFGVEYLDAVPGSSWQVNPPTVISVTLWYGSLIYLFTHARVRKQKVYAIALAGFSVLLALWS